MAASRAVTVVRGSSEQDDAHVLADFQRTKQVLLNLISNAIKYNVDGGNVTVSIATSKIGSTLIEVTDTGIGIDPQKIDRLFAPFERLDAEGSGVEGTGLGLVLSKALVDAMNGSIYVRSSVGNGSTFSVELPASSGPLAELEPSLPLSLNAVTPLVLYAEDNYSNLSVIEHALGTRIGAKVVAAKSGEELLELVKHTTPSVILLDNHLADVSGIELLEILQSDQSTAKIPVIVTSADDSPSLLERAMKHGCYAFVPKPIDVAVLTDAVRRALQEPREALAA